jgi:hypothetical protein
MIGSMLTPEYSSVGSRSGRNGGLAMKKKIRLSSVSEKEGKRALDNGSPWGLTAARALCKGRLKEKGKGKVKKTL